MIALAATEGDWFSSLPAVTQVVIVIAVATMFCVFFWTLFRN